MWDRGGQSGGRIIGFPMCWCGADAGACSAEFLDISTGIEHRRPRHNTLWMFQFSVACCFAGHRISGIAIARRCDESPSAVLLVRLRLRVPSPTDRQRRTPWRFSNYSHDGRRRLIP